ncbi:MAG: hypothetical protein AAF916_10825 [Planctomycetota bacterium]
MNHPHDPPELLTPAEADRLLRYPRGRSARLARRGLLPHLALPDGEVRFPADLLDRLDPDHPADAAFPRLADHGGGHE